MQCGPVFATSGWVLKQGLHYTSIGSIDTVFTIVLHACIFGRISQWGVPVWAKEQTL